MGHFHVGEAVRVLVSSPAVSEQVGIVIDVARPGEADEELFLVRFPDRFMRYYQKVELGAAPSNN
ncbi:MAG TPA: hypothetical protein VE422_06755 [Terriglobia bacterium]|nr:hypothetical protein [Terriglobia bacterium]